MQKNDPKASLRKAEKLWLGLVVLFYLLYNLPGVPPYKDAGAAMWHGALTLIPLWAIIYYGMFRLFSRKKIRNLGDSPATPGKAEAGHRKEGI